MKRFLFATAVAVAFVAPVQAADMPVKAPIMRAPAAVVGYSWTGCYIGAHVGGAWGRKHWQEVPSPTFTSEFDVSGVVAGGQVGCDIQSGQWVFGVEGTGSWTNIDGDGPLTLPPAFPPTRTHSKIDSLFTVTGRIGFAADRTLFYVKGGGAFAHEKHRFSEGFISDEPSETRWGWLGGAGIEHAFAPNWSAKIEYNYIGFGTEVVSFTDASDPLNVFGTRIKQHLHVLKVGLNYRFGGPVVARY